MPRIELSVGPIDYTDTGGAGPVVVFGHGVPMSGTQWREVVPLMTGYRCVLPTLPMGGHEVPVRAGADLSHRGQARLLGELVEALQLDEVTLVLNDWGGGQFLVLEPAGTRVARMALVACEAFDNFPPPPARVMARLAAVPGGIWLLTRIMAIPAFSRSQRGYGIMSLRPLDGDLLAGWFGPATRSRAIRRDFAAFARSAPGPATLLRWSDELRGYDRPVLVVWAAEDKVMPADHGRRLAELYPQASSSRSPAAPRWCRGTSPTCWPSSCARSWPGPAPRRRRAGRR